MLDVAGCIVTIDALGCQTQIVETIVERGGDYVIAVKANQRGLRFGAAGRWLNPVPSTT